MKKIINRMIDRASEYFAYRKGFLPGVGLIFVLLNWFLQLLPASIWLIDSNTLLHLGVALAIVGFMLSWVL